MVGHFHGDGHGGSAHGVFSLVEFVGHVESIGTNDYRHEKTGGSIQRLERGNGKFGFATDDSRSDRAVHAYGRPHGGEGSGWRGGQYGRGFFQVRDRRGEVNRRQDERLFASEGS